MKCIATTRAGTPCKNAALPGTKLCLPHTPGMASACGKIGGPRRRLLDPSRLVAFDPPTSARELSALVSRTIVEIREAKLEAKTANAIACLASSFLACLNHGDIEDRVAELEARFREQEEARNANS